jgi:hypothetical protein
MSRQQYLVVINVITILNSKYVCLKRAAYAVSLSWTSRRRRGKQELNLASGLESLHDQQWSIGKCDRQLASSGWSGRSRRRVIT